MGKASSVINRGERMHNSHTASKLILEDAFVNLPSTNFRPPVIVELTPYNTKKSPKTLEDTKKTNPQIKLVSLSFYEKKNRLDFGEKIG